MALSPLKNKQIEAFHDKGLTVKEIGRKTHCSHAEIRQLLKSKGKVPIEEKPKEKEPETADTVSDSVDAKTDVSDTVSMSNHIIDADKCQAALVNTKKELSLIYKRLTEGQQHAWDLGELYHEVCTALGEEEE